MIHHHLLNVYYIFLQENDSLWQAALGIDNPDTCRRGTIAVVGIDTCSTLCYSDPLFNHCQFARCDSVCIKVVDVRDIVNPSIQIGREFVRVL